MIVSGRKLQDHTKDGIQGTHVEADHGAGPGDPVGEGDEGVLLDEADGLARRRVELGAAVPRQTLHGGGQRGGGGGRGGAGGGGSVGKLACLEEIDKE